MVDMPDESDVYNGVLLLEDLSVVVLFCAIVDDNAY